MPANDPVEALRAVLDQFKARGEEQIDVEALRQWLTHVPARVDDTRAFEEWKARAPLEHQSRLEMFKSVIESGGTALKTLVAINGGAAVALLAFVGNLISKGTTFELGPVLRSMLVFVFCVGFAAVSSAARYLAQLAGHRGATKTGNAFTVVSIVVGLASLFGFFVGGWMAYCAMR